MAAGGRRRDGGGALSRSVMYSRFPSRSFFIAVARRIRISRRENLTHTAIPSAAHSTRDRVTLAHGANFAASWSLYAEGERRFAERRREVRYIVNSRGEMRAACDAGAGGQRAPGAGGEGVEARVRLDKELLHVFRSSTAQHRHSTDTAPTQHPHSTPTAHSTTRRSASSRSSNRTQANLCGPPT